jgi:AraC family transcriptional regulator of arabinose operon
VHPDFDRVLGGHFREGPRYSTWRTAGTRNFLVISTLDGRGRFGGPEGELVAGPGDAVLLRPGVRHDYGTASSEGRWEFVFAHFHPRTEWLPLLDWPLACGTVGHVRAESEVQQRVVAALLTVARMRSGPLQRAELFAVNALEEALLWLDTQNPLASRTDERVLRVTEYVAAHLAEPLPVERLAAVVHLSPSRLTHLFTEYLGRSPQRYVEGERMSLAKHLLDLTDRPIADIAREVGWVDPLYFSSRFARSTGVSPSEHRRRRREGTPSRDVAGIVDDLVDRPASHG